MNGKVAVITGGTRGIGLAIAAWMLEHGANVVVSGRDADRLNVALKELTQDGGSAAGLVADVTRREDAERVVELARERFGRLDVLVNNAGITRDGLILRMKDDDWDRVLETNLKGAFLMTRAASKAMVRAKSGGRILNIASTAGTVAFPPSGPYSASKHAQLGFSRSVARELRPRGIHVHTVNPGFVHTEGFPQDWLLRRRYGRVVVGPEHVADRIVHAIERDRAEIFVPRWYRAAAIAQALLPGTFRRVPARRASS